VLPGGRSEIDETSREPCESQHAHRRHRDPVPRQRAPQRGDELGEEGKRDEDECDRLPLPRIDPTELLPRKDEGPGR
jgi:hypothetical protein